MSIKHECIAAINNIIDATKSNLEEIEFFLDLSDTIVTKVELTVVGRDSIELSDVDIFNEISRHAKEVLIQDLKKLLKVKSAIIKIDDE